MRITFFGRLADSFGRSMEMDLAPGTTVAQLRAFLTQRFPDAAPLTAATVRACVGDAYAGEEQPLSNSDEVEFWPPVSGG